MNTPISKPTAQYNAERFVESCGAIVFDLSSPKPRVCLVHYKPWALWMLAKGRRNFGEPRQAAALREAEEETGYRCQLLPVTMMTRAPAATDPPDVPDEPRSYDNSTLYFMVSIREMDGKESVKIIWWYIAKVDDRGSRGAGEADFDAEFFDVEIALDDLTYESDKEVLRRALHIINNQ